MFSAQRLAESGKAVNAALGTLGMILPVEAAPINTRLPQESARTQLPGVQVREAGPFFIKKLSTTACSQV
jgi:hypothetical protein